MNQKHLINLLLSKLIKNPKFILPLLLIGLAWYGLQNHSPRAETVFLGTPLIKNNMVGESRIIQNKGFVLEYSETLKNPIWVSYLVKNKEYKVGKRPRFNPDSRTKSKIEHRDYSHSGYSRGHMAPNYLIASRYGPEAQQETFLMSNISPQKHELNQKAWQRLEEVVANDFSEWHGDFWVFTGPIFGPKPQTLRGSGIKIPKAFYKILIKPDTSKQAAKVLAFVMPQSAKPNSSLMNFVSTVDEVEAATGIDFFHQLEDSVENKLEASKVPTAWRLQKVANRPARY